MGGGAGALRSDGYDMRPQPLTSRSSGAPSLDPHLALTDGAQTRKNWRLDKVSARLKNMEMGSSVERPTETNMKPKSRKEYPRRTWAALIYVVGWMK